MACFPIKIPQPSHPRTPAVQCACTEQCRLLETDLETIVPSTGALAKGCHGACMDVAVHVRGYDVVADDAFGTCLPCVNCSDAMSCLPSWSNI
jgi:hypothetical protein